MSTGLSALFEIGRIGKPHGVRGDLKVRLHNKESAVLDLVKSITLDRAGVQATFAVAAVRGRPGEPIVQLAGVSSREQAEPLVGALVLVPRASMPPLEPGEYYLVDTVGLEVRAEGSVIGKVKAVRPDPTVDTWVIELVDGRTAEQPILEIFVAEVDVARGFVELRSQDGLID